MAEEARQEQKADGGKAISTFLKVILGLVFLLLGVLALLRWWKVLLLIIKGCLGPVLILVGIITLVIAKE